MLLLSVFYVVLPVLGLLGLYPGTGIWIFVYANKIETYVVFENEKYFIFIYFEQITN